MAHRRAGKWTPLARRKEQGETVLKAALKEKIDTLTAGQRSCQVNAAGSRTISQDS